MLSSTIFFFHDFKKEAKTRVKDEHLHHIVKTSFFVLNELYIADKIRNINDEGQFYIFDMAETLRIAEPSNLRLYSDASILLLKDKVTKDKELLLTFEKCDLMYLDLYLKALSCSKKYIKQLVEFYRHLLQSIDLLVSHHLVHNNINFNTIAIKLEADKPILTNFTHTVDCLNKAFNWSQYFLLKKMNSSCPVEFYLLQYQLTNKLDNLSLYNIETVLKQFIKDHDILNSFSTIMLLDNGLKYFKIFANKSFISNLEEALKYSSTWDNYALSIVYLEILIGLHRTLNANNSVQVNNKFIISFMKLLVENISLDPSKRSLPDATLVAFEDMLETILICDFKELLEACD